MVKNPQDFIIPFSKAGADLLTVHVETAPHLHRIIQQIKEAGMKVGISLNPSTPLSSIEEVIDEVDMVLIMSVNPGFGGQQFIPASVDKIKRLKQMIKERSLSVEIQVDGGINRETAQQVIQAGATILVAGSAVYQSEDVYTAIQGIRGA